MRLRWRNSFGGSFWFLHCLRWRCLRYDFFLLGYFFYTALFAPAKTPKEIIDRLHAETARALAHPKTREIYAASAAEPGSMSPADLQAYVAREIRDWAEVVRATGLKVD